MPFLTDSRCKQKYPQAFILGEVCAGETGQNKDTCQVFFWLIFFIILLIINFEITKF